jgi:REP element-mobilizing transposase RayT
MRPSRTSTRLPGFTYGGGHAYLVTICTAGREPLFGEIPETNVALSPLGRLVDACWQALPAHHTAIHLDAFVIMPDHIHGIVGIAESSPTRLGSVVGGFKSAVSREARLIGLWQGGQLWQRGYHDRIIRDPGHLDRLRRYVVENPIRWGVHPTRR